MNMRPEQFLRHVAKPVLALITTAVFAGLTSLTTAQPADIAYNIPRISNSPTLDGTLSENEWSQAARIEVNIETNPSDNIEAAVKAHALVMEDGQVLYVAFVAEDPDPSQIRAFYRDRDRAWSDDWMGILFDTFNDERRAFEFFTNPLGVQMDAIFDDVNQREDSSWNGIWESIGQVTETGYTVELAIPLKQLRFRANQPVQIWGIEAIRRYPRNRITTIRSNPRDRDISCAICQFSKAEGLANLEPSRNLEIIPTLTTTAVETRDPAIGDWEGGDLDPEASLDVRWGITQDMYLNATLNPDFSQVEADSAQLDINNTFSLFFPERRTFFLDGADYFNSFRNLVYTRNIANPDYGLKLTGKTGDHTYAVMTADDDSTSFILPGNLRSRIATLNDTQSNIAIARYRYDIFQNSSIGTTFTDRRGDDYQNSVLSVDAILRPTDRDTLYLQSVHSETDNPVEIQNSYGLEDSVSGHNHVVEYRHNDARWDARVAYEDIGDDFRADLGFINRVGYKFVVANVGHTWRWDSADSFFTRIRFAADYDRTEDQNGLKLEEEVEYFINGNGPWQSYFNILIGGSDTYWNGQYFEEQFNNFNFGFSPYSNLEIQMQYRFEDIVDFTNTQLGESVILRPEIRYQWGQHLQLNLEHTRQEFDVDGGRLFTANITDFRTTYQFNTRSFLRLILQYSDTERDQSLYNDSVQSRSKNFTTQLLYSYKVNAATRFFVGYSDAGFQNDSYDSLQQTNRTFFAKFSYAWQP